MWYSPEGSVHVVFEEAVVSEIQLDIACPIQVTIIV